MRVAVIYYHDLRDKHAGGILQYIRGCLQYAPPNVQFIYWYRESSDHKSEPIPPRTETRAFAGHRPRRLFVPETIRLCWRLWRTKRKIEADCDRIFLHNAEFTIPWMFGASKQPITLVIHGGQQNASRYQRPGQRLVQWIAERVACRVARRIIMVSRESLEHYKARFPRFSDKFCYVSTFADDATIPLMTRDEAKKELGLLPSQVLLSYVGRLHPQKRVDETIDVFFKLVPNHPDLVLWIAGGGELEADLRAQASRLGLDEKQLRFLGVIDRATVGCLLRASDLSILLTNWEGTPMSLLESLAIGTPAVVSDVADHRRIIADGVNGYVVGRGDVEAIANVLETALNEKERLWKGAAESGQQYLGSRVVPQILGHVTS